MKILITNIVYEPIPEVKIKLSVNEVISFTSYINEDDILITDKDGKIIDCFNRNINRIFELSPTANQDSDIYLEMEYR